MTSRRLFLTSAAALFVLSACDRKEASGDKAADQPKAANKVGSLAWAVAGDWRPAQDKARDRWRHPIQTLTFWGLKPGMTVVEFWPGAGWYTDILGPYLTQNRRQLRHIFIAQLFDKVSSMSIDGQETEEEFFGNFNRGVTLYHHQRNFLFPFAQLVERHKNKIFTTIYLIVKDQYIAEDLFQETFIKVIHSIQKGKYNHEDKFLPWVLRIARNMSIDTIRARKRMPVVVDTEGRDVFDSLGITVESQEEHRVAKDDIDILRQWIWELPEDQREVLILRQYADLSFKEIAALTETNINTCIGRMHYAILNLRKKMQKSVAKVK